MMAQNTTIQNLFQFKMADGRHIVGLNVKPRLLFVRCQTFRTNAKMRQ